MENYYLIKKGSCGQASICWGTREEATTYCDLLDEAHEIADGATEYFDFELWDYEEEGYDEREAAKMCDCNLEEEIRELKEEFDI